MRKIDITKLEQVVMHYDIINAKLNTVLEHSYSDEDVIIVEDIDRRGIRVTELIREMITSVMIDRDNVSRKLKYFKVYFKDQLV